VHAQFGVGVLDQLSADVDCHAVDGAGELEWAGVGVGDRGAGVGAAGEGARVEDERRGDGCFGVPGEGAVDVELEPAGRALGGQAWWSLGFEATGPASLLRSGLEATAVLRFAQAVPGVEVGMDNSRSYAEWLGRRQGAGSDAARPLVADDQAGQ
jgi:hypothetical protein